MAVLNVRIPDDTLEALQVKAEARSTTVSALIRDLLAAPGPDERHVHAWEAIDTRILGTGEREYLLRCPCGHETWG
jgi:plasmid stability protein